MTCRSGCPTQDHVSWGACARSSNLQLGDLKTHEHNVAWDQRFTEYASAVKQGVQPKSTSLTDTRAALRAADNG